MILALYLSSLFSVIISCCVAVLAWRLGMLGLCGPVLVSVSHWPGLDWRLVTGPSSLRAAGQAGRSSPGDTGL